MRGGQAESAAGNLVRTIWLGWLVFVVYGSLVPLDFQPMPLSEALDRFAHVRLLDVGVQGRADWVANGVLYVPVGLLTALVLAGGGRLSRPLAGVAALLLGCGLALWVEFTQVFFPPRTVSLNDLVAEGLGCLLGVVLASVGAARWAALQLIWQRRRPPLMAGGLLSVGALVLFALSLFPFDVLISTDELAEKLHGPFWGWWRAPLFAADGWGLTLVRALAEAFVLVPLGAWWVRLRLLSPVLPSMAALLGQALWLGGALGLAIEVGQWFVASGVSQGLSVFSRALGWGLGAMLGVLSAAWGVGEWRAVLRRWTLPVMVCCLGGMAAKAGWLGGPWRSADEALLRLSTGEIHFLPFYYHYFTSEGAAVQSVVPVLLLFAPVGVLCWAWRQPLWQGSVLAAVISAVAEAGRLFAVDARPDPTNVWIAVAAATASAWVLYRVFDTNEPETQTAVVPRRAEYRPARPPSLVEPRGATPAAPRPGPGPLWWLLAAGGLALVWLWRFPVFQPAVGLLLVVSAALVWWRPVLFVAVVAAGLPVLNLTIWSGREFVDEFDVLLLVCLMVAWARRAPAIGTSLRDRALGWALALVGVSLVVSTLIGWAPWDAAALQHPDSPISPWYALRLFKGALLAALLIGVASRQISAGEPVAQAFGSGMVVGLAGVLAFVIWERMVFVGLLNFADEYRVAGPVLPMRLGGAYLDAFLVASLPFALVGTLYARFWAWRAFCAVTAVGTGYAMAVTFTRSTYLAVAVVVMVVSVGVLRPWPRGGRARLWLSGALMALLVAAAYPIITGPFASARMAVVSKDAEIRLGHARHVIAMAGEGGLTSVFGQGLGRFPAHNYWTKQLAEGASSGMAVHQFLWHSEVSLLQLGAGPVLFLDQPVYPHPGERLQIALRARAAGPGGKLVVMMCNKWLLASGHCESHTFVFSESGQGWQQRLATLNTGPLGGDTGLFQRPVRLSLYNAGLVRVDVDAVSVRDPQGTELVRNGEFDAGSDHWSYTSDDHLAWHVKNMALAVWFDLGWFGVLAFGSVLVLALGRSGRAAWHGDRSAQALFAAMSGLLIVSVFDSVVDEPRFLLLLLVLAWMAARSAMFDRLVKRGGAP